MQFKNVAMVSTAGVIAALAIGAGGAYAATQIGSADIKDNSVRSIDLKDGSVHMRDIRPHAATRLHGKDADMSAVTALQDRVAALEANAADGSDANTNWENGVGATIADANTVVLDSRTDGYAYATIRNLDLPVSEDSVIEFTYKLDNGAHVGWGAPRVQFRINGVKYSSANQINPDWGHDNGDGTFTVTAKATTLNDNNQTPTPEGTIDRASLVYDYQDQGTVTFTNVVIDGHPISFK